MTKENTIYATGRRKTAIARIWLTEGTGNITVNNKPIEAVFTTLSLQNLALKPLNLLNLLKKVDAKIYTKGGGIHGQAGAVSLAIARILVEKDAENRPELKAAGLLTRDARMKERKKAGQPGARKQHQFSKR